MTRDEFAAVVREAVETLTVVAEQHLARQLPRDYQLRYLGGPVVHEGDDIIGSLCRTVFVSPTEIYPCVDLFLDDLGPDSLLRVVCYRAGDPPCPFGESFL